MSFRSSLLYSIVIYTINMFMTVEQLLKKRKQTRRFSTTNIPSKTLIQSLFNKTFEITPSKQNFYPYQVFVIGPEDHKDRKKFLDILNITPGGTGNINAWSAPYILLFCSRFTKEHPDPKVTKRIKERGLFYEQTDAGLFPGYEAQISLEVGMFAMNLTALCMEKNIDVSYQQCLPVYKKTRRKWRELSFMKNMLIIEKTLFCMQLGHKHKKAIDNDREIKPNIEEVIKFI